ncbi:synaptogyrin-1-like [Tachypleus tridentatus]|uniref:synaptogyrin-1-like n=1 Tax=Tachypleus tridentatus TaxID=6853 RepID=UPI003FD4D615
MEGRFYGAGKAGGSFDPLSFIQRPQVILRSFCWIFAIVVFGCIVDEGWLNKDCIFNKDNNACNYGVGVGVIAFLASMGLLVGEALFESISSVKIRRRLVLCDLGFSGFWSFMFFVGFCYLCDAWRRAEYPMKGFGVGNARAAIAFSFFSIFLWAGCAYLAFKRYRLGLDTSFGTGYDAGPEDGPYSSYPRGPDMNEAYQDPPFPVGSKQGTTGEGVPNFPVSSY